MALTVGSNNKQRDLALRLAPAIAENAVRTILPLVTKQLKSLYSQYGNSSQSWTESNSLSTGQGKQRTGASRKMLQGRKKKRASTASTGQNVGLYGIGRTLTSRNSQTLNISFNDVMGLSNGVTAGNQALAVPLGVVTNRAFQPLASYMGRFSTMSTLYRQVVIRRIILEYVPAVSSTDKGILAMGFDPSPMAGAPTTYNDVTRHTSAKMFDIKANTTIVYSPATDQKKDPRYTTLSGFNEDEVSFGLLQIISLGNSLAANAQIGILRISVDVTLLGPL